ncbi:erythromycin esterase family protein [Actinoplanes sp. L3-i22]|uniref:erythromycin esterase family protein n=1 Tax=Actinoplanes sp. L3-i22 TaxID=2836373 RepID=UPI001C75B185|nr:erythromycin esterase family protein [Actinoplanes sp. L3-i22]BCY09920.1 erythromycin esterase [Actinoplanes sp. L3-i22]
MDIQDVARPLDGAGLSAFLHSLPARPDLLGLGEPRHFVGELGEVRNDIFRHLVEHEGYRSLAVESDCLLGTIVDDYVTTGAGTLDDVLERGFSHRFGTAPGNRELVRWMRAYNQDHDGELRFFGFDGPLEYWAASPREALTALYDLLDDPPGTRESLDALLGPDERWSDPATVMDPARSIGQSADARRLRVLADDLLALLDTQLPGLSARDRERARRYGRTAVGLLRYHHWMADTSPARISRLSGLRDAMMAANLLAVAEHGPALVFTHNLHLQRRQSVMSLGEHEVRMWSAGAILSARLGDRFAFLATAFGTVGDDVPPGDTVEGLLATLPWDTALVDTHRLAPEVAGTAARVSADFAYFPLDPAHLDTIDGIVFLKHARDVRELNG